MKTLFTTILSLLLLAPLSGFGQVLVQDPANLNANVTQNSTLNAISFKLEQQNNLLLQGLHQKSIDLFYTDSVAQEKLNPDRLADLSLSEGWKFSDDKLTLSVDNGTDLASGFPQLSADEQYKHLHGSISTDELSSEDILESLDNRIAAEREIKVQYLKWSESLRQRSEVLLEESAEVREYVMEAGHLSMTEGERLAALSNARSMEDQARQFLVKALELSHKATEISSLEQFKLQMDSAPHQIRKRSDTFKKLIPAFNDD